MWSRHEDDDASPGYETTSLDIESLASRIQEIREETAEPFLDKRARETSGEVDMLEELQVAYDEITNKETLIGSLVQMTEFLLETASKLMNDNEMIQRTKTELIETLDARESLIESLQSRMDRSE
jgi:hypothetical protein